MNNFVKVDGGTFVRKGDYQVKKGLSFPEIMVRVNGFYIDDFVVTQGDWNQVMDDNPSYFKGDDLPVERVGWHEAILFCNKKSEKDGLQLCYTIDGERVECDFSANGYRLPTEAEWEFAAIGGVKSKGYRYAGSDLLDEVAWYSKNAEKTTHPRGQKLPNELGLYDMCGNVFEWCWDWWDKFDCDFMDNPTGPATGKMKVVRGNNWVNGATTSDLNRRVHRGVNAATHHQGFRIVRSTMTTAHLEQQLNHPDKETRLQALRELVALEPQPSAEGWVNNHIHTCYSFSPYSPSAAVFYARRAGLATAGIMDHDSVGGCAEFTRAGAIAGMPVTTGFELRVNMDNTPLRGKRFNSPDQRSIAYVAAHGVPKSKLAACETFLAPLRQLRIARNRRMVKKLNGLLAGLCPALDFDRDIQPLSRYADGGSVTERHILCGLSLAIMERYGRGEATFVFLQDQLGIILSEKVEACLRDSANPHYLYDLIGALKSGLLSRLYIDAAGECPDVFEFIRFVNEIGAISAYAYLGDVGDCATGDKRAQGFEDSYLEELFGFLKQSGFHAVTYMPSRNTIEQLRRVMALCEAHELFQISGEDINTSRQSFICPALAQPAFRHLNAATWALIGHEAAAGRRIEDGMFSEETLHQYPSLAQRISIFEKAGKTFHRT